MNPPHAHLILRTPGRATLWQGDVYAAATAKADAVDVILCCANEVQPSATDRFPPGVTVLGFPFDDTSKPSMGDISTALEAAQAAYDSLKANKRVLITCFAGRNRSGLVSALIVRAALRMTGDEAVDYVKARRPNALTNESFCAWMRRLPKPGERRDAHV